MSTGSFIYYLSFWREQDFVFVFGIFWVTLSLGGLSSSSSGRKSAFELFSSVLLPTAIKHRPEHPSELSSERKINCCKYFPENIKLRIKKKTYMYYRSHFTSSLKIFLHGNLLPCDNRFVVWLEAALHLIAGASSQPSFRTED